MRKKIIVLFIIGVVSVGLVSCSSKKDNTQSAKSDTTQTETKKEDENKKELTQDELNAKIKSEAKPIKFVDINGHEDDFKNKSVYIEGEVTNVDNTDSVFPKFTVTTNEDGGSGMYNVMNMLKYEVKQGQKVKIYGKVTGKDSGLIQITANAIE
ncbi:DNA-binding protein [Clostridium sp. YIM B02551]|uniref:DNA-binding protein n=1 Tax=Clostridium sp. YIM B02551 TaxID=2910679 RepID=UPI001EEC1502|nr:DNA-binding protein [Clostridium sp. YIM B02551]